jgi:hypothetical protein
LQLIFVCGLHVLLLWWIHLLFHSFLCIQSLGFATYKIISSVTWDNFSVSFSSWLPFYFLFFICPMALARTSSTMLNRSGKTGIFALFLILEEKILSLSQFSMMLTVGFSNSAFIILRCFPSIPSFLNFFYHERVLSFVKCLLCINWKDNVTFSLLHSVNLVYSTDWFSYVELLFHSSNKSRLVILYNPFNMLWNLDYYNFADDFCLIVHIGYWSVVFL